MHKILLATAVALIMGGCATQPGGSQSVQVRDLSMGRDQEGASSYTVQPGDTIYGIAWRNEMDFRRLAQLNRLKPPYRLEPGQELRLTSEGAASGSQVASAANPTQADDNKAGAAQGGQGSQNAGQGNPDWLAPDEEAIRRNQGIVVRPLESSQGDSTSADGASGQPQARPDSVSSGNTSPNAQGPGPIYNYGSPGADGKLSQRDQAERETMETAQQSQEKTLTPEQEQVAKAGQETAPARDGASQPQASEPAVATQPQANQQRAQRTYTPAKNIDWQWPTQGKMVNGFGEGESTTAGIDIAGQKGQPVKAAGPGIVVYAGSGVRGYGNLVFLKHNDQFLSAYAHNDQLQVQENDVVETGETIATMGDTDADSVMLHFEVRKGGQPQNPLEFLPKR